MKKLLDIIMFLKYDKSGIKQEYVNFCNDRAISNVELGLDYLNKIQ